MKRKGYDKNFDKEKLVDKNKVKRQEEEFELKRSFSERKRKLPMNIIEFIVGVGLLFFWWSYIQSHPAEKTSLFSGFEVIVEKAKVKFTQWTTGQGPDLQNKIQLIRVYDEILSFGEEAKDCLTAQEMDKVLRAKVKLEELSVTEFMEQERAFSTVAKLFYTKIKEDCGMQQK